MEKLDIKWLIPVSTCHTVERCSLAGSEEVTPAQQKAWSSVKCVLLISWVVVTLLFTSVSGTADRIMFINLCRYHLVDHSYVLVTVVTTVLYHQLQLLQVETGILKTLRVLSFSQT